MSGDHMTYLEHVTVDVKDRLIFLVLTFFLAAIGVVIYYLISNGNDDVSKMKRYVSLQFILLSGIVLVCFILMALLEIATMLMKSMMLQFVVSLIFFIVLGVLVLYCVVYFILFLVKGRCDMIGISSIAQRYVS